jgi:hypothetical protein
MVSREEREVVINWTEGDAKATVYSLVPRVSAMCVRAGAEEIRHDEGIRGVKKVARTFLVDIGCIVIRKRQKRVLSPEERERLRERGRDLARSARSRSEDQATSLGPSSSRDRNEPSAQDPARKQQEQEQRRET